MALEESDAFGHLAFPRILRSQRRQPSALPLEFQCTLSKCARIFVGQFVLLCVDDRLNLQQGLCIHGLSQNSNRCLEWIDPIDEVDVELRYAEREPAHTFDEGGICLDLAITIACQHSLGLLGQTHRSNRLLADRFLIVFAQFGVLFPNDLAHLELGQLFWNHVGVEYAAFNDCLVLHKGRNDLVEILAADTRRLDALWQFETLDLEMHLAVIVHAKIGLTFLVSTGSVVEVRLRPCVLWGEVEAGCEHLLH